MFFFFRIFSKNSRISIICIKCRLFHRKHLLWNPLANWNLSQTRKIRTGTYTQQGSRINLTSHKPVSVTLCQFQAWNTYCGWRDVNSSAILTLCKSLWWNARWIRIGFIDKTEVIHVQAVYCSAMTAVSTFCCQALICRRIFLP